MKISLKWLSRYVDLDGLSPEEIRDHLTMSTAEIEDVIPFAGGLEDLVVGEVLETQKHPDADKLTLCQVTVGGAETLSIVCGAPNVETRQKVVVVQPGHVLPDGTRIKKTKIRGQVSMGMICSERELGLSDEHEGIIVLDAGSRVGKRYIDQVDVTDHVLEIDNKSINHRPDLWGHLGFARELSAITRRPLKDPVSAIDYPKKGTRLAVTIQDKNSCPRYIGLVLDRVRVIRSPDWLRFLLHATDVRSINLPVDLTNFVMLELGQPMHAFDLRHLSKEGVGIRMAKKGESMATLDGVGRNLLETDLLIISGDEPVALAGIMGGEGSMVASDTTQVFLESANFHPTIIRRTSSRLGLRTDSSARFEKSLDPANAEAAVHRYTSLLMELCQGSAPAGPMVDPAHWEYEPNKIRLRKARLATGLGIEVPDAQVKETLTGLQFAVDEAKDGWDVTVPSFRATKDISIEDDLIEEVGRMYRYDNIPEIPLRTTVAIPHREEELFLARTMLEICALELQANEVYNYSFVPDRVLAAVNALGKEQKYATVTNPVAPDLAKVRRHVLPSLLSVVAQSLREQEEVRLVEDGRGYQPERRDEHGLPHESRELCLVYSRRDGKPCYPQLRSDLVSMLGRVGFPPTLDELRRSDDLPWIHPGRTVALQREGMIYGYVGILHPEVSDNLELPTSTAVATVDVRQMLKTGREEKHYQPIPRFPPQPVDVAFLVPVTARVADLQKFLLETNPKLVRKVELFEVYRGDGLPEDKKSLNFTVTLGAEDRTLTAKDEEKYLEKVRASCAEVGAELRG